MILRSILKSNVSLHGPPECKVKWMEHDEDYLGYLEMIKNCLLSYLSTNWFQFQIYHAIGLRCSLAKVNHYI